MEDAQTTDYATRYEDAPEYKVVKVTWWNGMQWCTTHEVALAYTPSEGVCNPEVVAHA